jgi:hypothetical protein
VKPGSDASRAGKNSLYWPPGYEYDRDAPDAFSGLDYFPEALGRKGSRPSK